MSDIELELLAFLGGPFGASIAAEVGQDAVSLIFLAGASAQAALDGAVIDRHLDAARNGSTTTRDTEPKEAA